MEGSGHPCGHSRRRSLRIVAPGRSSTVGERRTAALAERTRGEELFETHCAVCHGAEGMGEGPGAPPPTRDFSQARFKLVSARNGAP